VRDVKYELYREFPDGISASDLEAAVETVGKELESMRRGGENITYLGSEVFEDDAGRIVGTLCAFDGQTMSQVESANRRAGVPFARAYRRGARIAGERDRVA
jgi:hypothetical protein